MENRGSALNTFTRTLIVALLLFPFLNWNCKKTDQGDDNTCGLPSLWKTIPSSGNALTLTSALELAGGDLLVAGTEIIQDKDWMYIARLGTDGNLIWKNTSEQGQPGIATSLLLQPDGGCIVGCQRTWPLTAYVVRLDADGAQIWTKDLNNKGPVRLVQLPNDMFGVFVGNGKYLKLNPDGAIATELALPDAAFQMGINSFIGEYYRQPHSGPSGTFGPAYFISKVSTQGQLLWDKEFAYSYVHPCAVKVLSNGEILVALSVLAGTSGTTDIKIIRLDANGNELSSLNWEDGKDEWPVAIQQMPDGEILVAVVSRNGSQYFPTLLRVSSSGAFLGAFTHTKSGEITGLSYSSDSCQETIIVSGKSGSEGFVWRTDKYGN